MISMMMIMMMTKMMFKKKRMVMITTTLSETVMRRCVMIRITIRDAPLDFRGGGGRKFLAKKKSPLPLRWKKNHTCLQGKFFLKFSEKKNYPHKGDKKKRKKKRKIHSR